MAGFEIRIGRRAAKELDRVSRKKDRQAIAERILALAEDPRPPGCVKLSGEKNLYRIRQGRYRIVYAIEDDRLVVIVIRIAHRKDVYRKSTARDPAGRSRPFDSRDENEH